MFDLVNYNNAILLPLIPTLFLKSLYWPGSPLRSIGTPIRGASVFTFSVFYLLVCLWVVLILCNIFSTPRAVQSRPSKLASATCSTVYWRDPLIPEMKESPVFIFSVCLFVCWSQIYYPQNGPLQLWPLSLFNTLLQCKCK